MRLTPSRIFAGTFFWIVISRISGIYSPSEWRTLRILGVCGDLAREPFAQLAFEDLASRVTRQVVHEEYMLRDLEGGETLPGMGAQLLYQGVAGLCSFLEGDDGGDGFDPLRVRQRYDGHLAYRLVVVKGVLDLAPGDLHAAGVD